MSTPTPTWKPTVTAITSYAAAHHLTPIAAEIELIKAHLATQQATAPHTISSFDFFARIPDATWSKIRTASLASDGLGIALHRGLLQLSAASTVIANNPDLLGMLTQLVAANVITNEEKTQMLSF